MVSKLLLFLDDFFLHNLLFLDDYFLFNRRFVDFLNYLFFDWLLLLFDHVGRTCGLDGSGLDTRPGRSELARI